MTHTIDSLRRRRLLQSAGAAAGLGLLPAIVRASEILPKKGRRVVVVGGGFGGTIAAKILRIADPKLEVVLVERDATYTACPTSNLVLAGTRRIEENQFGYQALTDKHGVIVVHDEVTAVDPGKKQLVLTKGTLSYDRLILSPGIDFTTEKIAGYGADTAQKIPHAWKAGAQTVLLRRQLEAMKDGGVVVVSIPTAPFRCPPGPYERICLIGEYLKAAKPKSKIIVLDGNPDIASKGALFRAAWSKHYAGLIDYRPGQSAVKVDAAAMAIGTEVDEVKADVLNLIPPQRAGSIAIAAGLADEGGRWCPVDPVSFLSTKAKDIHVIGDACIAAPMPKSGFSANSQAKVCALNLVAELNGEKPTDFSAANICYSFVSSREAISIAAVYKVEGGKIVAVPGAGGLSPEASKLEADYGRAWFANIIAEMKA
jgi:sulfide dehydrogenase [flavocytochrome c] flavoprotein subunit